MTDYFARTQRVRYTGKRSVFFNFVGRARPLMGISRNSACFEAKMSPRCTCVQVSPSPPAHASRPARAGRGAFRPGDVAGASQSPKEPGSFGRGDVFTSTGAAMRPARTYWWRRMRVSPSKAIRTKEHAQRSDRRKKKQGAGHIKGDRTSEKSSDEVKR